ncbi:hypothetical protein HC776_00385 [bacterium]|nr:hypothetical protein [bacterium]
MRHVAHRDDLRGLIQREKRLQERQALRDRRAGTRHLLAEQKRLETMLLPSVCPQLNPQEHVWSQARARGAITTRWRTLGRYATPFGAT